MGRIAVLPPVCRFEGFSEVRRPCTHPRGRERDSGRFSGGRGGLNKAQDKGAGSWTPLRSRQPAVRVAFSELYEGVVKLENLGKGGRKRGKTA